MPFRLSLVLCVVLSYPVFAQQRPRALAILEANCIRCHNSGTRLGGLSVASSTDLLKGGAHGGAVTPGKPDDSLLYRMISGDKPKMPAGSPPLDAADITAVRDWIEQGAPWPANLTIGAIQEWWSLQPVKYS